MRVSASVSVSRSRRMRYVGSGGGVWHDPPAMAHPHPAHAPHPAHVQHPHHTPVLLDINQVKTNEGQVEARRRGPSEPVRVDPCTPADVAARRASVGAGRRRGLGARARARARPCAAHAGTPAGGRRPAAGASDAVGRSAVRPSTCAWGCVRRRRLLLVILQIRLLRKRSSLPFSI